jgi:hypothetical protein
MKSWGPSLVESINYQTSRYGVTVGDLPLTDKEAPAFWTKVKIGEFLKIDKANKHGSD